VTTRAWRWVGLVVVAAAALLLVVLSRPGEVAVPGRHLAPPRAPRFTTGFRLTPEVDASPAPAEDRNPGWQRGSTLTGRVLDAGGGVIPGARIRATSYVLNAGGTHDARVFQAEASGEGRYRLELPAGRHTLSVVADGYAPLTEPRDLFGDRLQDFVLQPAARISGRVVTSEGRTPVAGARVWAQRRRWDPTDTAARVVSDERGGFVLGSLGPGTYLVTARKEGLYGAVAQPIVLGETDAIDGLELAVSATFALRGRVTSAAGAPVPSARIRLAPGDGAARDRGPHPLALTDDQGRYLLDGVPPGNYRIVLTADGHASREEPISVAGDIERDVVLQDAATVVGVVLMPGGQPARNALVRGQIGGPKAGVGSSADAFTDAQGRFTLTGLGGGDLVVTAMSPPEVAIVGPEPLATGGRKQMTIRLGGGAGLAGVVSWDDGSPIQGAQVTVVTSASSIDVRTRRDGSFAVRGLPPGDTWLRVVPLGRHMDELNEAPPGRDQARLTLEAGEQKTGLKLVVPRP
jgi:hypothetical protein